MQLIISDFFSPSVCSPKKCQNRSNLTPLQGLDHDVFEKSAEILTPAFGSRRNKGKTDEGVCLKKLDDISCPYTGTKMISTTKLEMIKKQFANRKTINEQLKVIKPYESRMMKYEKRLYDIFTDYGHNNPSGTVNSCLQEMRSEYIARLQIKQLKILDEIDEASKNLNCKNINKVRDCTNNARIAIIEDKPENSFKRKKFLDNLCDVALCNEPNREIKSQIYHMAEKLPTSTNDFDAFVVKLSRRSPYDTADGLLRSVTASVEHIDPASKTGNDKLSNFMTTTTASNNDRSNTPLDIYVELHPDIPMNSQKYANDIINAIHTGKLTDCDWYPYMLKEKLYNESNGKIDIDISKYKISEFDAMNKKYFNKNKNKEMLRIKNEYCELKRKNADIPAA